MNHFELKEFRNRFGLTAKEMALKLKTPLRTYEGWEQGRTIPGVVEVAVNLIDSTRSITFFNQS